MACRAVEGRAVTEINRLDEDYRGGLWIFMAVIIIILLLSLLLP
jgi:hypothetical protein